MPLSDRVRHRPRPQSQTRSQPLSPHNQELLMVYVDMYNQTTRRIDLLYRSLEEIRDSIDIITGVHERLYNNNNNSESNLGESFRESTPRPSEIRPNVLPRVNIVHQPLNGDYISLLNLLNETLSTNTNNNRTFFDRVVVNPTAEQIIRAVRVVRFSSISNPPNTECPITLESFEDNAMVTQIRHCGHVFNSSSINSWFRSNVGCPVCRYDIREYGYSNTNQNQSRNPLLNPNQESQDDLFEDSEEDDMDIISNDAIEPPSNNSPPQEEDVLTTFSNMSARILEDLMNIPHSTNHPIEFENTRYYIDPSNNQYIFEGILRNNFR